VVHPELTRVTLLLLPSRHLRPYLLRPPHLLPPAPKRTASRTLQLQRLRNSQLALSVQSQPRRSVAVLGHWAESRQRSLLGNWLRRRGLKKPKRTLRLAQQMLPRAVPLPKPKLERKEDHVLVLRTIDPARLQQLTIPDACHTLMRSLRVNPGSCELVVPTSPAVLHWYHYCPNPNPIA
jgi:hypothetical protein